METYTFKLAEFSFQIQIDWPVRVDEKFKDFLIDNAAPCQERVNIVTLDRFPDLPAPAAWYQNRGETLWNGQRCILHRLTEASPAPYLMECYEAQGRRLCYLTGDSEIPRSMSNIFNDLSLEEMLLRQNACILHSSFIRHQGRGILFSAPSGTGKSTQADLWQKYMDAEILNGDRSILRKSNGRWTAYGLPFAGSSEIFRNESAPISAIVMLAQGPENRISPLSPAQAFRRILPEVTLHRWDSSFMNQGMDLIMSLLCDVPVFLLSCRPDKGAVDLLHQTIQEV